MVKAVQQDKRVDLGRISGVYGVKGWVKVFSYTSPRDNILSYDPWLVFHKGQWQEIRLVDGRVHGKGVIALLEGVTDRDQAALYTNTPIAVAAERLPVLEQGDYYWSQLMGLRVRNLQDEELGIIDDILETGANDVLVVKGDRERLIPYVIDHFVKEVNLEQGVMRVDWSSED